MKKTPLIKTNRLILKPLVSEDAKQIQRRFPRWEIVRYLVDSVPWPYPDTAAQYYVDHIALEESRKGHGWFWTIRRKEDPEILIGAISLMITEDNNRGFWLVPEWQNQGYMTEACNAVTAFWFEELGRTVLRAPKAVTNTPSRKLSMRSGMRLIRTEFSDYVSGRLETEIWEMTREEWLKSLTFRK